MSGGGRYDFDDGGTYCGGWEDGKAHGRGICTGPKGQGEYSGAWQNGFEICGVYTWPSGNMFEGDWMQGKRHGLGIETKGRWVYKGEWTQGFKGRYGTRISSSGAKYEGTWTTGLQDGYGVETYADGGMYQGQWLRGMRHGYGVRQSVPYGLAAHYRPKVLRESLTSLRSEAEEDHVVKDRDRKVDESRGGFVLRARSDESPTQRRKSIFDKHGRSSLRKILKLKKQKSTGDIQESPRRQTGSVRSTISNISHTSADSSQSGVTSASFNTDSNLSFISQDDITDANVTETYMGEWKNDKRSGFGISERTDGLKYEGEWYNNMKYGYGVTTFKNGTKEEGKYKNNVLISSGKKSKLFLIRSSKLRERVDNAVAAAQRAAQIALQKGDIAISRMANARAKAEQAEMAAKKAQADSGQARLKAKQYAPEFHQPGTDILRKRLQDQTGGGDMDSLVPNMGMQNHNPNVRSQSLILSRVDSPGRRSQSPAGDQYAKPGASRMATMVTSAFSSPITGHPPVIEEPDARNPVIDTVTKTRAGSIRATPPRTQLGHEQPTPRTQLGHEQPTHYNNNSLPANRNIIRQDSNRIRPEKFTDLLNSTTVHDHFGHYGANHEDSGLGRELDSPDDRVGPLAGPHVTDRSPDSGMSDTDDVYRSRSRPLQRRKTLPSIMKQRTPAGAAAPVTRPKAVVGETVHSQQNLSAEETDTYIIENGIRKRIRAEVYATPSPMASVDDMEKLKTLPKRYTLEPSLRADNPNRGSLPDVSVYKELEKNIMPREEVHKLSEKRREEIRRLREEEERRKQQEIVLRLSDFKDWCQQRQLLMVVIALNVSLATMFFNLLSQ